MPMYTGIGGVRKKITEMSCGINGVKRDISEMWAGISGTKRQIFQGKTWIITYECSTDLDAGTLLLRDMYIVANGTEYKIMQTLDWINGESKTTTIKVPDKSIITVNASGNYAGLSKSFTWYNNGTIYRGAIAGSSCSFLADCDMTISQSCSMNYASTSIYLTDNDGQGPTWVV